jgi:hypothetical protein
MAAPPHATAQDLTDDQAAAPAPPVHDFLRSDAPAILDQTIVLFDSVLYGSVADGT